jgi:two-component system LytT family response regulator
MRVLIVDDERPARERLRTLLAAFPDLEVAGECEDGEDAVQRINSLHPDLVMLDVQMPGLSGIEVAGSLAAPRPKIIFCTAYDQYAVDAFDLSAVDYLLKPVNRSRLAQAIDRVRALNVDELNVNIDRALQRPGLRPARFLARQGGRCIVIPQKDVVYLGSEGGLTKLFTADRHYVMDPTLNDFERRLDPAAFFRISRTALVNLDWIASVDTLAGGFGEVATRSGIRLEVSRRKLRDLLSVLEGGAGSQTCGRPPGRPSPGSE